MAVVNSQRLPIISFIPIVCNLFSCLFILVSFIWYVYFKLNWSPASIIVQS